MLQTLSLTSRVDATACDFLAKHYDITATAPWQLDFDNDVYQLRQNTAMFTRETTHHLQASSLNLVIDFRVGKYQHRNKFIGKEPLVQAIKIKGKLPSTLFDATPGLLQDSFMLSNRGIKINAIERHPLLYIMVNQALSLIEHHIDYQFGDAIDYVDATPAKVIYLDPMYPPRQKSAKVKKNMQILHDIIGRDDDSAQLLIRAKQNQQARVIVKRPNTAPYLGDLAPNYSQKSQSTRFDIYLPN